jgi:hypothetical protein
MRAFDPSVTRSSLALVLVLLLAGSGFAHAQTATEYQVKAAYVYNFAKFVEWPAQDFPSSDAPIHICVLNNPPFERELNQIVKGKTINGRGIAIVSVKNAEESRACHILFTNASQDSQTRAILETLSHRSVLTVGETAGFVEKGGIINFIVVDDRVQFQVNHRVANEVGLRISSRLLSVAKLVAE